MENLKIFYVTSNDDFYHLYGRHYGDSGHEFLCHPLTQSLNLFSNDTDVSSELLGLPSHLHDPTMTTNFVRSFVELFWVEIDFVMSNVYCEYENKYYDIMKNIFRLFSLTWVKFLFHFSSLNQAISIVLSTNFLCRRSNAIVLSCPVLSCTRFCFLKRICHDDFSEVIFVSDLNRVDADFSSQNDHVEAVTFCHDFSIVRHVLVETFFVLQVNDHFVYLCDVMVIDVLCLYCVNVLVSCLFCLANGYVFLSVSNLLWIGFAFPWIYFGTFAPFLPAGYSLPWLLLRCAVCSFL